MNNRTFAETDETFRRACELAGIPPTQRQASKFRSKGGKAWEALLASRNGRLTNLGKDNSYLEAK